MSYSNINNPVNYQLQGFGQNGVRTISTDQLYIQGEYYRVLVAEEDSYVTAVSVLGDDLTAEFVYAGTTIYGLFTEVSVSSGSLTAYIAGPTDIEDVWAYINAYGQTNAATIEAADCAKDAIAPLLDKYYAKASLVMVPSLYKTSIVYSERPLTTSGQLAFTRSNDTATRVGPDGYIEKVRTNLALYSEQFDNAAWVKVGTTVTANDAVSPDGYTNADALVENTATTTRYTSQQFTKAASSLTYALTIYYKNASGTRNLALGITNGTSSGKAAIFTTSGTITATNITIGTGLGFTFVSADVQSVANGFYRASVVVTTDTATRVDSVVYITDSTTSISSYTGNGTSGLYLFGAQLEIGDIATDYIPTTAAAVTVGPVANLPRLNYPINSDGSVGCPSLLLEPQRTNLALWSESFDNATWLKIGTTITANNAVSPDGYTNADALVENTATSLHDTYQAFVSASSTAYTFSCYIKPSTRTRAYLRSDTSAGTVRTLFDLTGSGSVVNLAHTSASISLVGNGWYRCSITFTEGTGAAGRLVFVEGAVDTSINYAGNGLTAFWLYGAQLEAGSYVTSYIPTLAASVTRGADACSKTGISSLIGQTQGTLFYEFSVPLNENTTRSIGVNDGTVSNRINISTFATDLFVRVDSGGVNQVNSNATIVPTAMNKVALRYKANDFAAYVNGVKVITDTSGSTFSGTTLSNFSFIQPDGSSAFNGSVKQIMFFPTGLTDQELQDLTTL